MEVTKQLADFLVKTKLEDIPPEIVQRGKELFLDFVGGSLPGTVTPAGKITIDYVKEMEAKPEATVIGAGFKTTAQYASLVNVTLAHCPEFEAIGLNYCLNPTSIIAVCLAMAEKLGIGGREALEGLILGHEVQGRIAAGSVASWGKRFDVFKFFHLGCAAAAAKMLKLDSDGVRTAVSFPGSRSNCTIGNNGSFSGLQSLLPQRHRSRYLSPKRYNRTKRYYRDAPGILRSLSRQG